MFKLLLSACFVLCVLSAERYHESHSLIIITDSVTHINLDSFSGKKEFKLDPGAKAPEGFAPVCKIIHIGNMLKAEWCFKKLQVKYSKESSLSTLLPEIQKVERFDGVALEKKQNVEYYIGKAYETKSKEVVISAAQCINLYQTPFIGEALLKLNLDRPDNYNNIIEISMQPWEELILASLVWENGKNFSDSNVLYSNPDNKPVEIIASEVTLTVMGNKPESFITNLMNKILSFFGIADYI